MEVAPFAAISSSGVRASEGNTACMAGRKSVEVIPITAASAKTSSALPPAKNAAAEPASAAAPTSAVATRTRSRR